MSRFANRASEDDRLPEGMRRVGYDSDTQVYTFQAEDGSYWESAPGCEYGRLTRVGHEALTSDDDDIEASGLLGTASKTSWRHDLMPLLNFGLLLGVSLLLFFWYLHWAAGSSQIRPSSAMASPRCPEGAASYIIQQGDTCWAIGQANHLDLDAIQASNPTIDCDKLIEGAEICLPTNNTHAND
ncbi:hypothetical protein B0I35DRAFT_476883 [Stachybotrys elegans]|uniref:LysM domain-containing protein n=1 Tax=Stachybotrys elegans TaxID=80388 RepID=A0A8K0SU82_9HYPO|nr:hypothetical protein B0I35DRAFT_476883 [Stachybotrys elegans]